MKEGNHLPFFMKQFAHVNHVLYFYFLFLSERIYQFFWLKRMNLLVSFNVNGSNERLLFELGKWRVIEASVCHLYSPTVQFNSIFHQPGQQRFILSGQGHFARKNH